MKISTWLILVVMAAVTGGGCASTPVGIEINDQVVETAVGTVKIGGGKITLGGQGSSELCIEFKDENGNSIGAKVTLGPGESTNIPPGASAMDALVEVPVQTEPESKPQTSSGGEVAEPSTPRSGRVSSEPYVVACFAVNDAVIESPFAYVMAVEASTAQRAQAKAAIVIDGGPGVAVPAGVTVYDHVKGRIEGDLIILSSSTVGSFQSFTAKIDGVEVADLASGVNVMETYLPNDWVTVEAAIPAALVPVDATIELTQQVVGADNASSFLVTL